MVDIIKLGKVRKSRAKAQKRQLADENAVRHGRSKGQKSAEKVRTTAEIRRLDGHKRAPDTPE